MKALVNTRSISWLLMPWLLTSPGHQQPWYWLCRVCSCLIWGRISTTWVVSMWRNDTKCKYMFMFPLKNLARKAPDTFIDIDVWIKVLGVGVKKCCSYLKAFIKAFIWYLFVESIFIVLCLFVTTCTWHHMGAMANQITGNSTVSSTISSGKHNTKAPYCWLLCEGNPPVTGGFPLQRASDAENVSM